MRRREKKKNGMNDDKSEKESWKKKKGETFVKIVWLVVGFYGISTFVGYLMPTPFLCK